MYMTFSCIILRLILSFLIAFPTYTFWGFKHLDTVNATPTVLAKSFLKLCWCLCQGLQTCMTFGCYPQINFCNYFTSLNLVIFGLKAYRHLVSCEPFYIYVDLFETFPVFLSTSEIVHGI